ncbi:MAG: flavin reductase [Actinobacteria bacterium]|nr:flavin reductase [Actinomycetota bacterium]
MLKHQHTYKNIIKRKDFCINFPEEKYLEKCFSTIKNNNDEDDEIKKSGFTIEKAKVVNSPRIKECFLNMECSLEWEKPLFEGSNWIILCGRVNHIAINEEKIKNNVYGRYGKTGYMYNIHSPKNPIDGKEIEDKIGFIEILK